MTVETLGEPVMTSPTAPLVMTTEEEGDVMTWFRSLGTAPVEVMTRAKHYYFNCDEGNNHYVYEVDESRRETKRNGKPGRKKRSYVGVMSTARANCPAEAARWESRHTCHARHDTGGNGELVGTLAGHPVFMARE